MHKYRLIAKKGEGTFSEVLKAQCIKNGKMVAIKCMKSHFESPEQVNNLREIQALRRLSPHPHIVRLLEVLYDQPTGRLALVFELMDMNIYELIRGRRQYLSEGRVKNFMYQLIKSMDHMHRNGIFHRDIKPENILILDDGLKLADFGSCRGIYSKQPYTEYISTRWYRAPECLLTDGYYNYKMDLWGVGCVFFEIVSLFPLFPGTNELDQIQKIHNIIGTPPPDFLAKLKRHSSHIDFNFPAKDGTGIVKLIPHASAECVDLIMKLLAYNPEERLSARQALRHSYFKEMRELEKRSQMSNSPSLGAPNSATASAEDGESLRSHPLKKESSKDLVGTTAITVSGTKPDDTKRSNALPSIRHSERLTVRDSMETSSTSKDDHTSSPKPGTLPRVHSHHSASHGNDDEKMYMPSLKVEGGSAAKLAQAVQQPAMQRLPGHKATAARQQEYIKAKAPQHSSRSHYTTRSSRA